MELESLELEKFKENTIKKEQMFLLNGGGTATPAGVNYNGTHGGRPAAYNYGYDVDRGNGWLTFHNRSNIVYAQDIK